jgi:hypothetical protein
MAGLISASTMQLFRKRFALASRPASPWSDSTRTTVGTTAGHSPAACKAVRSESAVLVRDASLENPPLSRTSTSACSAEPAFAYAAGDGIGVGLLPNGWFADFSRQFVEVLGGGIERVLSLELGAQRHLQ